MVTQNVTLSGVAASAFSDIHGKLAPLSAVSKPGIGTSLRTQIAAAVSILSAMAAALTTASGVGASSTGAPRILYTDITSGPVSGGENNKGSYLSIYGIFPSLTFSDLGVTSFVTVGGVNVDNYRCLAKASGSGSGGIGRGVFESWGIKRITVQVGALAGLTLGTAYPISISINGVSPANTLTSGFYVDLDGENLAFTPNPGRFIFVDPVLGTNPPIGTVPTGANLANGDGGFNHPVKDLQTYATGNSAFGGALTCPNSVGSTSSSNTLPPGSHVVLRAGTYTTYLTNTSFGQYRWACPWAITGNAPTGAINTGPIVITSYPGAAGSNAPEAPAFVGPNSASSTANAGGIHGTDSVRSTTANAFNSTGFGKHFHVSNLSVTVNPSCTASDAGPINLQNAANFWRVVNNECVWKATGATLAQTGGIQVVGDSCRIYGNWIHDIYGDPGQENHGIYNGEGGGIAVTNVIEAYNCIYNITNPTGVSVANGGSGIQFHQGSGGHQYTGCKVHHNVIDTTIKYGIDMVGGSKTIDVWANLLIDVQQIPIYCASADVTLLRVMNNTIIGCNNGNNFGYGGTGYSFIWNNASGLASNTILIQNNVIYQRAGAPTFGGYVVDNSSSAIKLDTNNYFDASGARTSKPAGDTGGFYGDPKFANLVGRDFTPGNASPLLNAGVTPASLNFSPYDLAFLVRPQGTSTKYSVGAFEQAQVGLVQKSATLVQVWNPDTVWESPGFATLSGVAAGNLLVTMGGWWDATHGVGGTQSLPTDSNGTIVAGSNPTLPNTAVAWPVHSQIGHTLSANAGTHNVTPQPLNDAGDGYFQTAEFAKAAGTTWTKVDSGSAFSDSATPGAINGVSVNTAGALAQVGDLVIAVAVTDGNPTAVGIGPATGYASLLATSTTLNNVSVGAGWKVVTVAGTQTAAWTWADNDCQIGSATIAVYRRT